MSTCIRAGARTERVDGATDLLRDVDVRRAAVVRDRVDTTRGVPGVVQTLHHDLPARARAVEPVHEQDGIRRSRRRGAAVAAAAWRTVTGVATASPTTTAATSRPESTR